jgi:hypothetical protein
LGTSQRLNELWQQQVCRIVTTNISYRLMASEAFALNEI